jgi:hypothetical protein
MVRATGRRTRTVRRRGLGHPFRHHAEASGRCHARRNAQRPVARSASAERGGAAFRPPLMPKSRKVWSSWSYVEPKTATGDRIDLTYWMNDAAADPAGRSPVRHAEHHRPIRDELIHDVNTFHHPVFDVAAFAAQDRLRAMNGSRNTWFCGAWMKQRVPRRRLCLGGGRGAGPDGRTASRRLVA